MGESNDLLVDPLKAGMYTAILENIAQGAVAVDGFGKILLCNAPWKHLFGFDGAVAREGFAGEITWNDFLSQCGMPASGKPVQVTGRAADGSLRRLETAPGFMLPDLEDCLALSMDYEAVLENGKRIALQVRPLPGVPGGGGCLLLAAPVLQAAEGRYALALKSADEGLYDWDITANIIFFSERLREMFGLGQADLTPDDWCRRIVGEDLVAYREAHRACLRGDSGRFSCEYRVRCPDGQVVHVRQNGLVLRDGAGRAIRLTGSVGDVTALRQAAEALRESEQRHALAMQSINEGVYEWDVVNGTIHVTPRLQELFDLPKADFSSQEWVERVHPDDRPGFLQRQRLLLKGEVERLDMEYRLQTGDGQAGNGQNSCRWVKQRGIAVRDPDSRRAVRVIGSSGDITDRKVAEEAIRDLIEAVPLPLVVTALADHRVLYVNSHAQRAYRISPDMGSVKPAYVDPQERTTLVNLLKENGQVNDFEVRLYTPDGDVSWALMSARPMIYQGEPAVLVASSVITGRKRLESDLKQAKERAEQAFAELQGAQQSLIESEKMASLGGLVAGVAHEINTPVGITLTTASHLNDKIGDIRKLFESGKIKKHDFADFLSVAGNACALLMSNCTRAANLIQSFKQVAVDQTSDERRRFDLASYIDEILLSLGPRLKRTSHQVQVSCPAGIEVDSYPGPLSQVLTNLVMNSLLHGFDEGRENGRICIDAQVENPEPGGGTEAGEPVVEITYRDNGKGIRPEHLKKIFDPFFTTKRGEGGSGLGLNIVYNIVSQSLKGTIRAFSQPREGVVFVLRFPLRVSGAAMPAVEPAKGV